MHNSDMMTSSSPSHHHDSDDASHWHSRPASQPGRLGLRVDHHAGASDAAMIHLESCTPGTRQYMTVCTGTYQYVPYSVHGSTRNLKMVHTSTYQHRKFLWQYILVCTGMYCLVPAQYKVVQGGTRWYKMVPWQGGTNNGIWRYMEVQGRTRIV